MDTIVTVIKLIVRNAITIYAEIVNMMKNLPNKAEKYCDTIAGAGVGLVISTLIAIAFYVALIC